MIKPLATLSSVDEFPIYREGATDDEPARIAETDPVGFHLRAFDAYGAVYQTRLGNNLYCFFSP